MYNHLPAKCCNPQCGAATQQLLLFVLLQQLANELFGQLAGVAEELVVKVVADGLDVFQGVLLGLAQKRRSTTEPVKNRF